MGLQEFLLAQPPTLAPAGCYPENVSLVVVLMWLKPQQLLQRLWLPPASVMFFELLSNATGSLTWRKLKH